MPDILLFIQLALTFSAIAVVASGIIFIIGGSFIKLPYLMLKTISPIEAAGFKETQEASEKESN